MVRGLSLLFAAPLCFGCGLIDHTQKRVWSLFEESQLPPLVLVNLLLLRPLLVLLLSQRPPSNSQKRCQSDNRLYGPCPNDRVSRSPVNAVLNSFRLADAFGHLSSLAREKGGE